MRNTQAENIQEHSLQVAMLAHALAIIKNTYYDGNIDADKAAVLGMYHDSDETITGDLPTPIKYFNPDIKDAYKNIETVSKNKLLSMLPKEMKTEYAKLLFAEEHDSELWALVKAADRIAAYIKCVEEDKAGNREFKRASDSIYNSIMQINLPEVSYFIEHFLPSYGLTLDELE